MPILSARLTEAIPTSFSAKSAASARPRVAGKFLYAGDEKLWVKGVTYGTFQPNEAGEEFHDPQAVERDFTRIAATGLTAIRVYTVPPRWLLDEALRHGLRVMVGLPWEQHVAFLEERARAAAIEHRVRSAVRACARHPAILCYVVGNEIPAGIVRWHGRRRVERYIKRLYRAAKEEDPEGLVTYVNYPTTEYLQLPFLDLACFNVYLESRDSFDAYLARLHNLTGDRPLIMAEIGLDGRRNGAQEQARALDWQIRMAFAAGCAGAFVFSWTDEWHRGGHEIEDWDFGLTDRARCPKPALAAVREAFSQAPLPAKLAWPKISVVVCTHNGARTIRDCFEGLRMLEYPNFDVIVVNDGSSDRTAAITREYGFRLISTPNEGLGSARNRGLAAATGDIVAYIDDDAWPDPHWLTYLASTFVQRDVVGAGGPNIPPPSDGPIAECVAKAPGGPAHVLLSDGEAEHLPGCNMAFLKTALEAIGGFDPQFTAAGDDVDVCWRLRDRGWKLGFHPSSMVWHHRRNSVGAYWAQQHGYGRAEALLERKWPQKYNAAGHPAWSGRVYGNGAGLTLRLGRIYQGTWGHALFQSVYEPAAGVLWALPLMPEWYLVIVALAALALAGMLWAPLLWSLPFLAFAVGAVLVQALAGAARASFDEQNAARSRLGCIELRALTALLHLVHPLARLCGRLGNGLTPWRRLGRQGLARPWLRRFAIWSEQWQAPAEWLGSVEANLKAQHTPVRRGGAFDRWDLEVRGGLLGAVRLRTAIEEHGEGRQLVRFKSWPRISTTATVAVACLASLAFFAALDRAPIASALLCAAFLVLVVRAVGDCAEAMGALIRVLFRAGATESSLRQTGPTQRTL